MNTTPRISDVAAGTSKRYWNTRHPLSGVHMTLPLTCGGHMTP
jgi:hypothetical protein